MVAYRLKQLVEDYTEGEDDIHVWREVDLHIFQNALTDSDMLDRDEVQDTMKRSCLI
jgi:hypothetical protein